MRALGIDLKAAIDAGRLELHYSEFGIGGGGRYSGGAVAATPAEVALRPFFGIYGPYARARDPWALPANGEFRREFYAKAAAWLAEPNMTTYRCAAGWAGLDTSNVLLVAASHHPYSLTRSPPPPHTHTHKPNSTLQRLARVHLVARELGRARRLPRVDHRRGLLLRRRRRRARAAPQRGGARHWRRRRGCRVRAGGLMMRRERARPRSARARAARASGGVYVCELRLVPICICFADFYLLLLCNLIVTRLQSVIYTNG